MNDEYDEQVKRLREKAGAFDYDRRPDIACDYEQAADAIEELSEQLLEMGQVGKFLLDVQKINSKMVSPESVPTDSEWWSHYKALLEVLYLPRWIPVTERLPVNTKSVLIVHRGGVSTGWHNGRYWERGVSTNHRPIQTVTHWMPLPEPPMEETKCLDMIQ